MTDKSHRKADPVPTKAERTFTPAAEKVLPEKTTPRDKGAKPDAQPTEE